MADEVVARRYAAAFVATAKGPDDLKALLSEIVAVRDAFRGVKGLHGLLMNPVVKESEKEQLVRRVFGGRVDDRILNFLRGIFKRRRVRHFETIVDEVRAAIDRRLGRHRCKVVSAVPLPDPTRDRVRTTLERTTGYTLDMRYREDPSILGGLYVHIDDMVLDARFSRSLSTLSEKLLNDRLIFQNSQIAGADADGGMGR